MSMDMMPVSVRLPRTTVKRVLALIGQCREGQGWETIADFVRAAVDDYVDEWEAIYGVH